MKKQGDNSSHFFVDAYLFKQGHAGQPPRQRVGDGRTSAAGSSSLPELRRQQGRHGASDHQGGDGVQSNFYRISSAEAKVASAAVDGHNRGISEGVKRRRLKVILCSMPIARLT